MMVAATDVQLSMVLPANWVIERFSGEKISTDPEEVRPQNLAPNDQMLYHLTVRNCGGDDNAIFQFTATATDPHGLAVDAQLSTSEMQLGNPAQVQKAVALITAARAMDQVWQLSGNERKASIEAARDQVQAIADLLPEDADLEEVSDLLSVYAYLF
jgi:hypothetical protein